MYKQAESSFVLPATYHSAECFFLILSAMAVGLRPKRAAISLQLAPCVSILDSSASSPGVHGLKAFGYSCLHAYMEYVGSPQSCL
jgi:hypothetical protein